MGLEYCNFRGCWKEATTKGFIYGQFKDSEVKKDKLINIVACDEHAKEKDFYPDNNQKEK